jgi:hypothetical protein
MAPPQDARRIIRTRVCTKAVVATARAECARQFGSAASTKYVDETVHEIFVERPNGRAQPYLNVRWDLTSDAKHKRFLLCNIQTAGPSYVSPLIDGAAVHAVKASLEDEEATLGKAGGLPYSFRSPDHSNRPTPTAVFHCQEWRDEEVTIPIGGPVLR